MTNQYEPTHGSPPGETINDLMEGYQIAPQKFAEALGLTSAKLERLFDGSLPITGRRAHRLEQVDAAHRTLIES